jgi:ubiquinone/menaquinone biosynthesis C-methylase UbiE
MSSDRGLHAAAGQQVSADAYDRYIGRWSRLFVPSLLTAAKVGAGDQVLDVATGTGEAAIAAISLVGDAGVVVGADISAAMLSTARARLPRSYRAIVTDGQSLALQDASFDAVICQLGLMFFPDPARGLAEFRRVLRHGGCAAVCVISTAEKAPMWGVLAETLSRHLPEQREALHLSFSLAHRPRLEAMLAAAGFRQVRVTWETRDGIIESFDEYWAAIEAGGGQQPLIYLSLPEQERRAVREEVRAGLSPFEKNGRLEMTVEMLIGVGRA